MFANLKLPGIILFINLFYSDMESAAGILNVMKQANIDPSSETYTVLMCGYAKRGDMESINKVMESSKAAGINLFDKDILEVVYTLAVNGHGALLDEVIFS